MKHQVVAAIPNYNMGQAGLANLLPQVLAQNYDQVFVLDDASTDDSAALVKRDFPQVKLLRNEVNRGAGPTRNLIIDQVGSQALIHFLDADVDLLSPDNPTKIRELFERPELSQAAIIGGLVVDRQGQQHLWNYGQRYSRSLGHYASSSTVAWLSRFHKWLPEAVMGPVYDKFFSGNVNMWAEPRPQQVYWVIERNMMVRADVFKQLGGFDKHMREHEIQDLSIRAHNHGYQVYFDPSVSVTYTDIKVRGSYWHRRRQMSRSLKYLNKKLANQQDRE